MQPATVKISNKDAKDGYCIINESDFDSDIHELFKGETATDTTWQSETTTPRKRHRPRKDYSKD